MENLTLLIPAKFESESLPSVLTELKKFNYKICVILKETDLVTINSIKNFNIEVIYQKGVGYGNALIEGINNCKTKYFCIFNADGSFNPNEISEIMKKINTNKTDFIFASRYEKKAGSEDDTFITLIGNYFFSFVGKIFFKLEISDILYTFVVGDTSKAKILNILSTDFQFCVELPIKVKRKKFTMDVYPSFERKRIAGKKKVNAFKDGSLILKKLIELFFTK
ncbi:glycosyltransferase [Candidatus Pelagibacter ubique]|uniref:glycosyltransferase n=1 Tax=Pelagibacter ubique TaxID=198252 RepID=UPI0003C7E5E1